MQRKVQMYSEEEVERIYALGRLYLEGGQLRSAELIFNGLINVKNDFIPSYLGLMYLYSISERWDSMEFIVEKVKKQNDFILQILIFESLLRFSQKDIAGAGTALGEVKDLIESNNTAVDQNIVRIFKSQISRYQSLI